MTLLPIVEHYRASITADEEDRVNVLAEQLLREFPDLALDEKFRPLVPSALHDAPALHVDDLSDIRLLDRFYDITFMQDRARLRAGDGDFVASCAAPVIGYEEYLKGHLGLGSPTWLFPEAGKHHLRVALACWKDRSIRHTLVRALRSQELIYIHPHMGTLPVWQLAELLHHASRRPVHVIAPPPGVTRWVNDKLRFAEAVRKLFGDAFLPLTRRAPNFARLTQLVRSLANNSRWIILKLPDSAGGGGNLRLESERFRRASLLTIRNMLKKRLAELSWQGERELLVGSWEEQVLCAPSAQLWIPPKAEGPPCIEGLYEQMIEGPEGMFVGSRPAEFPDVTRRKIVDSCATLALLYQKLGYVGRCSFDMLLVGENLDDCRLEFIECNGRWGGTSLPMTLMNRLFGDWRRRPYAIRECTVKGLEELHFSDVLDCFSDDLFDIRTGKGKFIVYNPGRMRAHGGINVLALGDDWEAARQLITVEFRKRLSELVCRKSRRTNRKDLLNC